MKKWKSILLWVIAVLLTLSIAVYQRMTGPTYPINGKVNIAEETICYKFPRSHGGPGGEEISIDVKSEEISGKFRYRRYKSHDEWTQVEMKRSNGSLSYEIPHQPPAGKVMYQVILIDKDNREYPLTEEPVIIRFKGDVPSYVLIPHIFFIFLAMVFSARTGLEAVFGGDNVYREALWTVILIFIGGLIFGPIIQKYAFDAYWTGWPFGHDLTDNKTLVAFIVWVIAFWNIRKSNKPRMWAIIGSVVLLISFLIPHSVLGSEIDHTQQLNQ
jgi:hypothetical protein